MTVIGYDGADFVRIIKMAAHQGDFFGHGDHFDAKTIQIGLLDDQAATRFQDPQQVGNRQLLVAEMVQGIDHQDPIETLIREG
jgi:hypothetical protein